MKLLSWPSLAANSLNQRHEGAQVVLPPWNPIASWEAHY